MNARMARRAGPEPATRRRHATHDHDHISGEARAAPPPKPEPDRRAANTRTTIDLEPTTASATVRHPRARTHRPHNRREQRRIGGPHEHCTADRRGRSHKCHMRHRRGRPDKRGTPLSADDRPAQEFARHTTPWPLTTDSTALDNRNGVPNSTASGNQNGAQQHRARQSQRRPTTPCRATRMAAQTAPCRASAPIGAPARHGEAKPAFSSALGQVDFRSRRC